MNKILIPILAILFNLLAYNLAEAQSIENETIFSDHQHIPGYGLKKMRNPQIFQGNKKKKKYFEGWYFKMVSADGTSVLSVIPGISLSQNGKEQHAFIQIIDGKTANTFYYTFPIEEFAFSTTKFDVRIGNNYFSEDRMTLNIQNDTTSIQGEIYMSDQVRLTNKRKKKVGIMSWVRFVPFMECNHGVVSLNHNLNGSITKNDIIHNFNDGKGYIEKDWGKSMPSSWIWMQSNSFSSEKTSLMLSVANIPWMGRSFTGFLGYFFHDNTIQRFATYTLADLNIEASGPDSLNITISNKGFTYHIQSSRNKSGLLKAPVEGSMDRHISESIDAVLKLTVIDKDANIIFNDSTSIAGLEIVGDMKVLIKSKKRKKLRNR